MNDKYFMISLCIQVAIVIIAVVGGTGFYKEISIGFDTSLKALSVLGLIASAVIMVVGLFR